MRIMGTERLDYIVGTLDPGKPEDRGTRVVTLSFTSASLNLVSLTCY